MARYFSVWSPLVLCCLLLVASFVVLGTAADELDRHASGNEEPRQFDFEQFDDPIVVDDDDNDDNEDEDLSESNLTTNGESPRQFEYDQYPDVTDFSAEDDVNSGYLRQDDDRQFEFLSFDDASTDDDADAASADDRRRSIRTVEAFGYTVYPESESNSNKDLSYDMYPDVDERDLDGDAVRKPLYYDTYADPIVYDTDEIPEKDSSILEVEQFPDPVVSDGDDDDNNTTGSDHDDHADDSAESKRSIRSPAPSPRRLIEA